MSAHTPGPWEFVAKLSASENHKGFFVRAEKVTKNGKWALAVVQPGDEDGVLGQANARLIAVAPELLAFAEFVLGGLKSGLVKAQPYIVDDPEATNMEIKTLADYATEVIAKATTPATNTQKAGND